MRRRNLFIATGLLAGALLLAACGQAASNTESAGSASADVQETADAIDQDDSAASGTSQGTDNNQQTVVDASDYFSEEDSLVSLLDMHPIDSWQFGGAAYEADGFKIEYATEDDGIMFSMSNEGNSSVILYGINLGDSLSDAEQKLDSYGWTPNTSSTPHMEFYKELNGKYFVLDLNESGESDTTVESWYINNWPQGEYDFSGLANQTGEK